VFVDTSVHYALTAKFKKISENSDCGWANFHFYLNQTNALLG